MVRFDGLRTFEAKLVFYQDKIVGWTDSHKKRCKYWDIEYKLMLVNEIREIMDEQQRRL